MRDEELPDLAAWDLQAASDWLEERGRLAEAAALRRGEALPPLWPQDADGSGDFHGYGDGDRDGLGQGGHYYGLSLGRAGHGNYGDGHVYGEGWRHGHGWGRMDVRDDDRPPFAPPGPPPIPGR